MKICSTCKREKPLDAFNKKSANADGRERYCKECHRTRNRVHYGDNKDAYKASARKFKLSLRDWYQTLKRGKQCICCGETKYWRLSFHHINTDDKDMEVSQMVIKNVSRARILAEIEKCVVVCHNCHSDIHHEERISR